MKYLYIDIDEHLDGIRKHTINDRPLEQLEVL